MSNILELKYNDLDEILIRQSLSLALMSGQAVKIIGGAKYVNDNTEYLSLFSDLERIVADANMGKIYKESDSIFFQPGPVKYGTYDINTDKFSSMVEIFLFLLPSLLNQKFRSILNLTGVSHSNLSHSTSFIKETMLSVLESTGFYASMTLKRFGFYGTGGGSIESRIYPDEIKVTNDLFKTGNKKILGAKVIISGLESQLAESEKRLISNELKIPGNSISIIKVLDCDGFGNSVQIFIESGNDMIVVCSREMNIYNDKGDIVFDEKGSMELVKELIEESKLYLENNILPYYLQREVLPYIILSQSKVPGNFDVDKLKSTFNLCNNFI